MKTKLACTLGPSLSSVEDISRAISLGCRIFRINFSHGGPSFWRRLAEAARAAAGGLGVDCVLIGDLRGGSVRVAGIEAPHTLNTGEKASLSLYGPIRLSRPEFFKAVEVGDILVTDDGRGILKVIDKEDYSVVVEAVRPVTLSPNKSLVIRGKEVAPPNYLEASLPEIDTALELGLDFIGLSFVRNAEDVVSVRKYLDQKNSRIGLIAKVETPSAVQNIDQICEQSDAVLIARGDLGMHFPLETVPRLQERIVEAAYRSYKPVIVATQLLGSMISEPVPSRSEIVDVMSCVKDGVDVLMLTGETAIGRYPLESIQWLGMIAETYEKDMIPQRDLHPGAEIVDRFALAVVNLAESISARIAIFTVSGYMARRIARFRPVAGMIAATPDRKVIPSLSIIWGVTPLYLEAQNYTQGLEMLEKRLEEAGLASPGDTYVLTYGLVKEPVHIVKMKKYQ
ncbi:MAG: pyruvate kinase [Nitrososphaerota archaeon]|nr:pyruvate kinase [Candidatus Calditenuaceae archaeon]MDW8073681.1 pyruvate kinase [Nitrososphaerota archaeon]